MELHLMPECGSIVKIIFLSGHYKSPKDRGGIPTQKHPMKKKQS